MIMHRLRIAVVGSGNWGTTIARIVGANIALYSNEFHEVAKLWVYEEIIDGRKLSEIINTEHINVKYLPNKKIPENIVAYCDLSEVCSNADVLVFVTPHQFIIDICNQLKGKLKSNAIAISLIKGLLETEGEIGLISHAIYQILNIGVSVLMGANLADEVADGHFCEATLGCEPTNEISEQLKKLFQTESFKISITFEPKTVELCGALKNIVACAAGVCDGLNLGHNTKAAIIRIGLLEITRFVDHFFPGSNVHTFFESCGIADLIATCYGGRNRALCEAIVKTKRSLKEVEAELLKGQSAQGPSCAKAIAAVLIKFNIEEKFPLFMAVNAFCNNEIDSTELVMKIRNAPLSHLCK